MTRARVRIVICLLIAGSLLSGWSTNGRSAVTLNKTHKQQAYARLESFVGHGWDQIFDTVVDSLEDLGYLQAHELIVRDIGDHALTDPERPSLDAGVILIGSHGNATTIVVEFYTEPHERDTRFDILNGGSYQLRDARQSGLLAPRNDSAPADVLKPGSGSIGLSEGASNAFGLSVDTPPTLILEPKVCLCELWLSHGQGLFSFQQRISL